MLFWVFETKPTKHYLVNFIVNSYFQCPTRSYDSEVSGRYLMYATFCSCLFCRSRQVGGVMICVGFTEAISSSKYTNKARPAITSLCLYYATRLSNVTIGVMWTQDCIHQTMFTSQLYLYRPSNVKTTIYGRCWKQTFANILSVLNFYKVTNQFYLNSLLKYR